MFRRKGSEGKKDKESAKAAGSDRESTTSSTGSGGIMNSMKQAIMKPSAEAPENSSKKAVKDGSAHPHAGSDARVRALHIVDESDNNFPFCCSITIQ